MTTHTVDFDALPNVSALTPFPDGSMEQYRVCAAPGCNRIYVANHRSSVADLCPDCREPRTKDRHRVRERRRGQAAFYQQREAKRDATRWTILYDPLPIDQGGFTPGVKFDTEDFVSMLALGCLSIGAKAQNKGIVYTVTGKNIITGGGKHRKARCGYSGLLNAGEANE